MTFSSTQKSKDTPYMRFEKETGIYLFRPYGDLMQPNWPFVLFGGTCKQVADNNDKNITNRRDRDWAAASFRNDDRKKVLEKIYEACWATAQLATPAAERERKQNECSAAWKTARDASTKIMDDEQKAIDDRYNEAKRTNEWWLNTCCQRTPSNCGGVSQPPVFG